MGAIFAFAFAVLAAFVGTIPLVVGIVFRRKRVLAAAMFVLAGICFAPMGFMAFVVARNVVEERAERSEFAERNGPLHAEIVYGSGSSALRAISEADAEALNRRDEWGEPPLNHICQRDAKGWLPAMRLAIERGADVNAKNEGDGDTPLHAAVKNQDGSVEAVRLLIESGADVNAKNGDGETPLHSLARNCVHMRRLAPEFADALLSAGADTSLETNAGETAAQIAERLSKGGHDPNVACAELLERLRTAR